MYTPWGYEVDEIPPIISEDEFNAATGNAYAGDVRLAIAIGAASAAIRNECGWHITPELPCVATLSPSGKVAKLPANLVTEITSVTENGRELAAGEFEARRDGLIRRANFREWTHRWGGVIVSYKAGYETAPELQSIAVNLVEAALNTPSGVASESAGGVSISYRTAAVTIIAASLGSMASTLAPYRLVSAHAT